MDFVLDAALPAGEDAILDRTYSRHGITAEGLLHKGCITMWSSHCDEWLAHDGG
jgi:hypothetical protein